MPSRYAAFVSTAFAVACLIVSPTVQARPHSAHDAPIAVMVALAAPTAHGTFELECRPIPAAGMTSWDQTVVLDTSICRQISRTIRHRHATPKMTANGLGVLLHEAIHVAQMRRGDEAPLNEHEAECGSLRALPGVLRRLRYAAGFVREATAIRKDDVLGEALPYGGAC
jgi:hypothetical protein